MRTAWLLSGLLLETTGLMCVWNICLLQTEIKSILEGLYGVQVESVKTINYLGKKKRSKDAIYRRADFKKAYVVLKDPQ